MSHSWYCYRDLANAIEFLRVYFLSECISLFSHYNSVYTYRINVWDAILRYLYPQGVKDLESRL